MPPQNHILIEIPRVHEHDISPLQFVPDVAIDAKLALVDLAADFPTGDCEGGREGRPDVAGDIGAVGGESGIAALLFFAGGVVCDFLWKKGAKSQNEDRFHSPFRSWCHHSFSVARSAEYEGAKLTAS